VRSFELLEPATLDEAVGLLDDGDPGVRAVAGATALVPMMKARLFQPTRLVSLRRLDGAMRGVRDEAGGLRIGALTTLTELERSARLHAVAPVMSRTLRTLSNVRIRNVATVGGHLAHGDPHMDLPPVLMTLGARIRAVSARRERWIDLDLPTSVRGTRSSRRSRPTTGPRSVSPCGTARQAIGSLRHGSPSAPQRSVRCG